MSCVAKRKAPEQNEDNAPWVPVLIESDGCEMGGDIDQSELWLWYIARIRNLAGLSQDQARLKALLNWKRDQVHESVRLARARMAESQSEDHSGTSFVEYLSADILARLTLGSE